MAISNKSDQSGANKQEDARTSIRLCKENTEALKKVNNKMRNLLDKLPLTRHREVVEINRLIEEQERLIRINIKGHIPLRIGILNDNEKFRASNLRRRFREAQRSGKLRCPK